MLLATAKQTAASTQVPLPQGIGATSITLQAAQGACQGYQNPGGHGLRLEPTASQPLLSAQPLVAE